MNDKVPKCTKHKPHLRGRASQAVTPTPPIFSKHKQSRKPENMNKDTISSLQLTQQTDELEISSTRLNPAPTR